MMLIVMMKMMMKMVDMEESFLHYALNPSLCNFFFLINKITCLRTLWPLYIGSSNLTSILSKGDLRAPFEVCV